MQKDRMQNPIIQKKNIPEFTPHILEAKFT